LCDSIALQHLGVLHGLSIYISMHFYPILVWCSAQTQLPEQAKSVLEVDEERFRGFVEDLVLRAIDKRKTDLGDREIVLGRSGQGCRTSYCVYCVTTAIPYCKEKYHDDTGIISIYVNVRGLVMLVDTYCSTTAKPYTKYTKIEAYTNIETFPFAKLSSTIIYTRPYMIYSLYKHLYKELGIGARPLLELAKKAEEEGDKEMAGILRKIYAILEASKDIIREIEEADYSQAAEEAVKLLRETKNAAMAGDTERLSRLLGRAVIDIGGRSVTLGDIVDHLAGEGNKEIENLLNMLPSPAYHVPRDPEALLKLVDIYDAIITVAEHFGLEVRRK